MLNGTKRPVVVSTRAFVGRRLRRFVLGAVTVNLLLCLLFLAVVTRTNSTQICAVVGINIQSYIDSLSREIVIGNQEHLATILETLKSNKLLEDVALSEIDGASNLPDGTHCQLDGTDIDFRMPVTFGQRQVGVLKGSIVWLPVMEILVFLGLAALFLLFFMWMSTRLLVKDLHKALITPIWKLARGEVLSDAVLTSDVLKIKRDLEASRENAQYAAVAQLTQMLAHDVRKPFSMIQIVLQSASAAQTLAGMKSIIYSGSQEINQALASVTGMLTDIMEIGQDNTRSRELVSPKSLIHTSLQEAGRLFSDSNITFSTSFEHTYLLEINPTKVQRVFSNIVENAVQAMKEQGHIWFHTTAPDRNGFVELVIGNSNSYIEPEDEQKLFDAFFTKDKQGGTGLGLAIAKKIVTAHGGQIGCRIIDNKGVEFWFTLPASKQIDTVKDADNITLPTSIMAFGKSLSTLDVNEFSEDGLPEKYETEIVGKPDGVVAVVDDSEFNCRAWIELNIGRPLMTFESPEMFWHYAERNPDFFNSLAMIITDHFFGAKSAITGIEFAKNMMDKSVGKPVFLSSVGDFSNALPIPGIAGVLPGKVMKWDELHAFCAAVSTAQAVGNIHCASTDAVQKKEPLRDFQVKEKSGRVNKAATSPKDRLKVTFFISAIDIIEEIDMAIQQQDLLQVAELAHKLQGSASIVGAHGIVRACQKLYYRELSESDFIALLNEGISTMGRELRSEGII